MSEVSCYPYLWVSQGGALHLFPVRPCPGDRVLSSRSDAMWGGLVPVPARTPWIGFSPGKVAVMRYASARMGRIFVARVDHGEDLIGEMRTILVREGVLTQ